MISRSLAGARAAGVALLAAALLAACGSDDASQTPSATPAATKLVVDTGSAAPVAGGTLTLKATLLGADGLEVKGASFAWTSSDEAVAVVTSASDKAPSASGAAPVGIYATVRTLAAGRADITATATLPDGSRATSVTSLVVQAAPARSYTLTLTPSAVAVSAGGAAQTVAVAVRRSDGVDGTADLSNWTWTSGDASFVVTPAADGLSAQVASPASATTAGAANLTACADAPPGRLCVNAALSRAAAPPPTYTVGGTLSGLASGKSLQLADSNGDTLVLNADGGFTLPTPRAAASAYSVTVSGQPASQTCTVQNGSGTVASANVTNLAIACVQAQFVVVPNRTAETVSVYRTDPDTGAVAPVPGSPFAASGRINDIVFNASGRVAYAAMVDDNAVDAYQLDPSTGALTLIAGSRVAAGSGPQVVALHPSGRSLYLGNVSDLRTFTIDPLTGSLSSGTVAVGGTGVVSGLAVAPDGTYVHAALRNANLLASASLDSTSGSGVGATILSAVGTAPDRVAMFPSGGLLGVTSFLNNAVIFLPMQPGIGPDLPSKMTIYLPGPVDMAVHPSGKFIYVLSLHEASIQLYTVHELVGGSAYTVVNTGTVATSIGGQRMNMSPDGAYLYAPSATGALHALKIDSSTGLLTPVAGSPFPAGGDFNTAVAVVRPAP